MTNWFSGSLRLCKYAGILYCCSHFVKEYIADLTWCTGPSMLPTIEDDHILFTEHVSSRFLYQYKRGDIVVFKSPMDPESYLCKRVIALELDKMPEETTWKYHQLRQYVPRGHVWVEGDNRGNSMDSRSFGPIPLGLIRGRATFTVWPPSGIGYLPNR